MSLLRAVFVALLLCLAWPSTAAETIEAEHVKLSWLAPDSFAAGRPELLAVHFEVDPGWHVYWVNPGDSGAAPRFDFSGNAVVGPVQWPYPHRLPVAHLTNLGYEGNVAYLFEVTPPADGPLELVAELEWLVCQEECIPGFATLQLRRPVAEAAVWNRQVQALRDQFRLRLPRPGEDSGWTLGPARLDGSVLQLPVKGSGNGEQAPELYPRDGSFVSPAAPQRVREADGWQYRFATAAGIAPPPTLSFVLVDGDGGHEFDGVALATAAATVPAAVDAAAPLWWLLALAFGGGVLLNLMPCVFPVLAIKLFSLIGSGDADLGKRLREGLLYSAGVLATFALLGGAFLALRAGGAAVGWGFQLQSPAVVLLLVLLFWVMALGFLGVFEFGQALTRLGGKAGGAFATGVLAVFVAAPCTGPFMGVALGAAATLPALQAMAIFLGLGAGLAAPFLLLTAVPALAARLPRPGQWMETLRQFLAFPLLATVLWLLWVLGRLGGDGGWLLGGGAVLLLSFALWLARRRALRWAGWMLALLVVGFGVQRATRLQAPQEAAATQGAWQAYDGQAIAAARAAGTPVFIDYTAAWCITCQLNKAVVLDTDEIQRLFAERQVLLVRADWTRYDPAITEALAALGRSSVPVYVFYPADGGEPRMLPQILKPADIRALF